VFPVELGVTVGFAERLFQDFSPIPRRSRRQDKRRAGKPESALQLNELALAIGLSRSRELAAAEVGFLLWQFRYQAHTGLMAYPVGSLTEAGSSGHFFHESRDEVVGQVLRGQIPLSILPKNSPFILREPQDEGRIGCNHRRFSVHAECCRSILKTFSAKSYLDNLS
jgi:hypothetical protein